jgi:hypothetical protein
MLEETEGGRRRREAEIDFDINKRTHGTIDLIQNSNQWTKIQTRKRIGEGKRGWGKGGNRKGEGRERD